MSKTQAWCCTFPDNWVSEWGSFPQADKKSRNQNKRCLEKKIWFCWLKLPFPLRFQSFDGRLCQTAAWTHHVWIILKCNHEGRKLIDFFFQNNNGTILSSLQWINFPSGGWEKAMKGFLSLWEGRKQTEHKPKACFCHNASADKCRKQNSKYYAWRGNTISYWKKSSWQRKPLDANICKQILFFALYLFEKIHV